ncbi:unnamed protein product [Ectocarpus sp. CCAP 1310/34]|nr:unnamed protein product [Ectocarpus sp. CCAP 1310/34]
MGMEDGCTYSRRRARTCKPYIKRLPRDTEGATKAKARYRGSQDVAIKRFRLSASPATGLVGMQENSFLTSFFSSVGFLPLTTRRDVRETMVTLMMSATRQQSIATEDCDVEENSHALVLENKVCNTSEGDDFPKTCTFWCAVAIGALAKGHPIESTNIYFRRAKEAMARYSGPTNFEVAKAWTILAYLHGFIGDMETFHEYLALSDSFVHDSAERGSRDSLPVGFPEVVKHGETIKLFTGTAEEEEVESLLAQEVSFPGECEVATEAHICRYIMQYHRAIEISIQQALRTPEDTPYVGADDAQYTEDGAAKGSKAGDRVGGICSLSRNPHSRELICDVVEGIQLQFPGLAHLEDAVERPDIRPGVGGLIINGTLFFNKTVSGDNKGALERLERCVEVFEGFPGLTRFAMGNHMAHVMLSVAASVGDSRDGGLYNRLRNACNLTRPQGSLAFPPLEEWQGISAFCDNVPCRSIEALFARRKVDLPPTAPLEDIKTLRPESLESIGSAKDYQTFSTLPSALRTPSAIDTFLAVVGEAQQGCDGAMDTLSQEDLLLEEASASPSLVNIRVETVGDAAEDCTCSDEGVPPAEAEEVLPSHAADEDAQDHVIAAEDWFDVIHAMLASNDTTNGPPG